MENRRRNLSISADDKFSFPVMIPGQSDKFEFGCVTTPGSPNSPADHLFLNGRLLPHVFPIQTSNNHSLTYSRSTSRTSSTGSKDSLMSSRSNSTNSRSSSARTSTSTDHYCNPELRKASNMAKKERSTIHVRPVLHTHECQYGSSQKWQFIAAAPVLKHQGSRSRKVDHVLERTGSRKSKRSDGGLRPWFGKRVFKSFVSACKECHAIKSASHIEDVLPRNLEV
ncbi:hypothetical protein F511_05076 [Dorcoceras hygrometricum]|uniref:Uncharacterized protein n=1 Tax=Dorcoceras hygrometricum TaxID=472368 RepID=A0A2Z7AV72_9LAMI|nr:hypothetical protein F511_05076 [Dorcoceras hygrometricum]